MGITICTVTFEADFRLTVLQLLSIDRLASLGAIESYILVLNGTDNSQLRLAINDVVNSLGGALQEKIQILEFDDLVDGPRVGYYDQQAAKLALANVVETEYYLMLDSKNHFVAPTDFGHFFKGSKPIMHLQAISDYWRPYVDRSAQALDFPKEKSLERVSNSVTPFLFKVKYVRELTNFLRVKYAEPLTRALEKSGGTEFILYSMYLRKIGKEDEYSLSEMPFRTLFTIWPQDPAIVEEYISDLGHEIPVFGLHRNRLEQLSGPQKALIAQMWSQHLLRPWEDATWFLEAGR